MFKDWNAFYKFAERNPEKAGRAIGFWDWNDIEKYDKENKK